MPNFPESIWDGRTATRTDLDAVRPPDHTDWVMLLGELQSMQGYILSLSGNMEAMPDLNKEITAAKAKLSVLLEELERLAPPADLHGLVADLQRELEEVDVRVEHERLKNGVKKLFLRTRFLEKAYKDLKENVFYQLEVLANSTRNQLSDLDRRNEARYKAMREDIAELQDILQNPDIGD